ncbi:hypothetical protein V5799_013243 [Amblyomma americanum]|uniref:Uncharacterized protein n=1 Tax=Amblyomma americanum TaxID=6943 RepID=A0AAQ4E6K8_AMBAM
MQGFAVEKLAACFCCHDSWLLQASPTRVAVCYLWVIATDDCHSSGCHLCGRRFRRVVRINSVVMYFCTMCVL